MVSFGRWGLEWVWVWAPIWVCIILIEYMSMGMHNTNRVWACACIILSEYMSNECTADEKTKPEHLLSPACWAQPVVTNSPTGRQTFDFSPLCVFKCVKCEHNFWESSQKFNRLKRFVKEHKIWRIVLALFVIKESYFKKKWRGWRYPKTWEQSWWLIWASQVSPRLCPDLRFMISIITILACSLFNGGGCALTWSQGA